MAGAQATSRDAMAELATLNFVDYSSDINCIKYAEIENSLLDIKNIIKEKDKSYSANVALLLRAKQLLEEKVDRLSTQLEQEKKIREQSDLIFGRKIAALAGRINSIEQYVYATKPVNVKF
jgi:hypothetical protein